MNQISEGQLQEIVKLAESVPEKFQEKCFEILLSNAVGFKLRSPTGPVPGELAMQDQVIPPKQEEFILPIDVKAFLTQYGLTESAVWNYFLAEGDEIRPIYQLSSTKKAEAQTQHALMIALETAMKTGAFTLDIEKLRTRCRDRKAYDSANFKANIKSREPLFKEVDDVDVLTLSPDGKSELADLLEALAPDGK